MSSLLIGETLSLLMFGAMICAILIGYPIVFTIAGVGFAFAMIGYLLGAFDLTYFNALPLRYWGILTNEVMIAVPLFIFMGVMLEKSGVAEDLLTTIGEMFGRVNGGLAFAVLFVGSVLAASTGIVGATVTTMGLISLPAMMKAGYDRQLSSGLICATGSLAQILPPSTVLVFLAVIMQTANSQVQLAKGNFMPQTLSVGDLFAAAFIPGLLLAMLYTLWIVFTVIISPTKLPSMVISRSPGLYRKVVIALVPTVLLIVAVLGSIVAGVASPTEAASVGAVGAIMLTAVKLIGEKLTGNRTEEAAQTALFWYWIATVVALILLALSFGALGVLTGTVVMTVAALIMISLNAQLRRVFWSMLTQVSQQSLNLTVMVFVIFLGATVFSLVFTRLGGEDAVHNLLSFVPGGANGAIAGVLLICFVLGMFLDTFEILFIVVPIAAPILLNMDVDPVWLSIMFVIVLQTSYLTPPFGFSLLFLRGVAPPQLATGDIFRGIVPFVSLQITALFVVWTFPALATWLPSVIYGQ